MKKTLLTGFACFLMAFAAQAQQDPNFTQYMFNQLYYNPGFAGLEGVTKVSAAHRIQWFGYTPSVGTGGAPSTQLINISSPLSINRMGIGFNITNDRLATNNRLDMHVSGAYHLEIKKTKLSLGVNLGIVSRGWDFSQLIFNDPTDPFNNRSLVQEVRPDLGLGAYWRSETIWLGVSFTHLLKAQLPFGSNNTDLNRSPLSTHAYFMGGYDYVARNIFTISPSVLVKTDLNEFSVDVGVVVDYDNKVWGGLTYRQSEAVNALVGYRFLDETLALGYSFDLVVTDAQAKTRTSHELSLSYILPAPKPASDAVRRTPRFRN